MAAPTILRTQHKLADYLFQPDLEKFNLPKKSSRPWIVNTNEQTKQPKSSKTLSELQEESVVNNRIAKRSTPPPPPPPPTVHMDCSQISNTNYLELFSGESQQHSHNNLNNNITDNNHIYNSITSYTRDFVTSSLNTKHKTDVKNKGHPNQPHNKNVLQGESRLTQKENKEAAARVHLENPEMCSVNLQQKLELDYQNHVNQMYNDPGCFNELEQFYHHQDYHQHHHHPSQYALQQQPLMYLVPLEQTIEEPTLMLMTPDTGSEYSSEDSSSCFELLNESSDYSDDEVFETSFATQAFNNINYNRTSTNGAMSIGKDQEYEVPIEMDEELNMLVLSIIDE